MSGWESLSPAISIGSQSSKKIYRNYAELNYVYFIGNKVHYSINLAVLIRTVKKQRNDQNSEMNRVHAKG